MVLPKIVFGICILSFFGACVPKTEERPTEIYNGLTEENPVQMNIELTEDNYIPISNELAEEIPIATLSRLTERNPVEMFDQLYEIYQKTEVQRITISENSEGASMSIYDINKQISEDTFCLINFMSSMGRTQYYIYKKDGEEIWYIYKKASFYDVPFGTENATIQNTYFIYNGGISFSFNEETGEYDNQADTDEFPAIADVKSLAILIEMIEEHIIIKNDG